MLDTHGKVYACGAWNLLQRQSCDMCKPVQETARCVIPFPGLRQMARTVAFMHGDKGALILTLGKDGVRIGSEGLTPTELRELLCVAISYSFLST
jgi:hypothetical protein